MIDYTPTSQLKIEAFQTPFEAKLTSSNRWVELGKLIPWDDLAQVYYQHLNNHKGRKALNARIAIGAMIIKHKLNLSDRETVTMISENPYMQHFLGMDVYHSQPLFDPSLFVLLRKRMGQDTFDSFTQLIIKQVKESKTNRVSSKNKKQNREIKNKQEKEQNEQKLDKTAEKTGELTEYSLNQEVSSLDLSVGQGASTEPSLATQQAIDYPSPRSIALEDIQEPELNKQDLEQTKQREQALKPVLKGKLKLDATVADIYIKYPTDLDLLAKSREWSEKILDKLYQELKWSTKPRTYRRLAGKEYLRNCLHKSDKI